MGSVGSVNNVDIKNAYDLFTSDKYKEIRQVQNGENVTYTKFDIKTKTKIVVDNTQKYRDIANAIEKDLKSEKYTGTLYRAISVDNNILSSYKVGAVIDQKGLSSWSTSENSISMFGGKGDNRVIFIENGTVNNAKDISNISLGKGENEVIQSSKNKQVINDIKKLGNTTYLYVSPK